MATARSGWLTTKKKQKKNKKKNTCPGATTNVNRYNPCQRCAGDSVKKNESKGVELAPPPPPPAGSCSRSSKSEMPLGLSRATTNSELLEKRRRGDEWAGLSVVHLLATLAEPLLALWIDLFLVRSAGETHCCAAGLPSFQHHLWQLLGATQVEAEFSPGHMFLNRSRDAAESLDVNVTHCRKTLSATLRSTTSTRTAATTLARSLTCVFLKLRHCSAGCFAQALVKALETHQLLPFW